MTRPAASLPDTRGTLDQCISLMVDQQLRGRCVELAVHLHHGQSAPHLLAEVEELAIESWALREGDDA